MFMRRLVLPFYVVGLVHTVFLAEITRLVPFGPGSQDSFVGWTVLVATPIACGALGAIVAPSGRASWHRLLRFAPAAGAMTGALAMASVVMSESHVDLPKAPIATFFGAMFGAVLSALYLPGLCFVANASLAHEEARNGSIFDRASYRAIWTATVIEVGSLGLLATLLRDHARGPFDAFATRDVPAASAIGFAILFLFDLRAYRRVQAYASRTKRPCAWSSIAEETIDYGIGDERHEEIAAPTTAYREVERIVRVYVGDHAQTAAFLARRVTISAVAFVAAAVATILGMRGALC